MRNEYYLFIRHHVASGWLQTDTIWLSYRDAEDAMMQLSRENPNSEIIMGYVFNGGILRIPEHISEVPR